MNSKRKYQSGKSLGRRLPEGNLSLTGFTLLELLIAMTVFAIVAASVYTSLHLGVKITKQEENRDETMQEAVITLKTLEKDLRCAFINSENDKLKFIGSIDHISFFSISDKGDLERVNYRIEANEGSELYTLLRSQKKYTKLDNENLPEEKAVNTKIRLFKLEYFNKNENKWYENWPEELVLPQQVRIEMSFVKETADKNPYELVKFVNIPIASSIDFSRNEKI